MVLDTDTDTDTDNVNIDVSVFFSKITMSRYLKVR